MSSVMERFPLSTAPPAERRVGKISYRTDGTTIGMDSVLKVLLAAGLLPLFITYSTVAAAWWFSWRHGGKASAVYIPLLGPVFLTTWIVLDGRPSSWLIPAVWICDLGTVVILIHTPGLLREWWQTSRFTLVLKLRGEKGSESATLTLHSGGHYLLRKCWARPKGECGIVELGELGTFVQSGNDYEITAHFGLRRILRLVEVKEGAQSYRVTEDPPPEHAEHSLNGWTLESRQWVGYSKVLLAQCSGVR
jgi:hypothetical protein